MPGASSSLPPPLRLFLGLWPDAASQAELLRHSAAWYWSASARRTRPERLHITLHFLGDVPTHRVDELKQLLQTPWRGAELELDRATVWPGGIAVLEASGVPPALRALHEGLKEKLAGAGLPVEERPYRPHVTLARKATGSVPPPGTHPVRWKADARYLLVQSLPGGQGYAPLAVFG